MGHVLLDTRENSFLSEFCVEEILLLELINAVCPVASVSSSSSERITKAISIICSSSKITHFYESVIKPYSQQIPRNYSFWKVKDLFVGIGVFYCFFSIPCWLFFCSPITSYQTWTPSPREENEASTMAKTCLLQDYSEQPVPDCFAQSTSKWFSDKNVTLFHSKTTHKWKGFCS